MKDHIEITQVCEGRVNQHIMPLWSSELDIFNLMYIWRVAPDICKVRPLLLETVSNFIFASKEDADLFCDHYSSKMLITKICDGEMTAKEFAAICGKELN